jgi:hypothetical protein
LEDGHGAEPLVIEVNNQHNFGFAALVACFPHSGKEREFPLW